MVGEEVPAMSKQISETFRQTAQGNLQFYCPGCHELHTLSLTTHTWDKYLPAPTFAPAFDSTSHRLTPMNGKQEQFVCAYYIVGGTVQYFEGCDHYLKGRIIALPHLPPEFRDQ